VSRREEWLEQIKLAALLDTWLDPACTFWTATDPVAPSVASGFLRKRRGLKPGVPDCLVWYRGKSITIELKSRRGTCSRSQRLVREALLRAGAQWWVCRTARAAMWALYKSGVPFRTIVHEDGPIERWQQPELPAWEMPKRDPHESGGRGRRSGSRGRQRLRLLSRRRSALMPQPPTPPHRSARVSCTTLAVTARRASDALGVRTPTDNGGFPRQRQGRHGVEAGGPYLTRTDSGRVGHRVLD
jgi:hypothetical protein